MVAIVPLQPGKETPPVRSSWTLAFCLLLLPLGGCGPEVPKEDLGTVVDRVPEIPEVPEVPDSQQPAAPADSAGESEPDESPDDG